MRRETRAGDRFTEPAYRPQSDRSLPSELGRMRQFATFGAPASSLTQYRLHPGSFYIKLCSPPELSIESVALIPGMYLPLEYWEHLCQADEVRGSRGGIRLSYESVGRHVTNSLFIDLLQDGWIGSRGITTDSLTAIVQASLEGQRSVILASRETFQ
jgi:hypothetical protein